MASNKNSSSDSLTFDQKLSQLESIIARMESQDLDLAQALELFEEGIAITRNTQKMLALAEQRIQVLLENSDKEISEVPLESED